MCLKRDLVMARFAKGCGAKIHDPTRSLLGGTSVLWGFQCGHEDKFSQCWQEDRPFLHIDHAYFKRGYRTPPTEARFRVNYCHFHQTRAMEGLSSDRADEWRKYLQPWKSDGAAVIVIVPSDSICKVISVVYGKNLNNREWASVTSDNLRRYTDRPILVKEKGPGLDGLLKNAWAVVSYSSVSEVESVMAGVPVFVGMHSPAFPMSSGEIENIERPRYPDREDWLRTLAYSQFTAEEMGNGKAWRILKELYGDH